MKLAALRLHIETFINICKARDIIRVVENVLPTDAKFIRAGHDQFGNMFLIIESESFDDVKEGDLIPELPSPIFERIQ